MAKLIQPMLSTISAPVSSGVFVKITDIENIVCSRNKFLVAMVFFRSNILKKGFCMRVYI